MRKKLTALLLSLAMIATFMPALAFAADEPATGNVKYVKLMVNDPTNPDGGYSLQTRVALSGNGNNNPVSELPDPEKNYPDWVFDGWWTATTGGSKVSTTGPNFSDGDEIYSHWKSKTPPAPEEIKVTFDGNNVGKWGDDTTKVVDADNDGKVSVAEPVDPADVKIFTNWYTQAEGGAVVDLTKHVFTASTTLYAHWRDALTNGYTVKFNLTEGLDQKDAPADQIVVKNGYAKNPSQNGWTAPTVDGKKFSHWACAKCNDHHEWDFSKNQVAPKHNRGKDNIILNSVYKDAVTVSFVNDKGDAPASQLLFKGTEGVKAVANPEATGYVFDGWLDENGNAFVAGATFTEDTTFTAQWVPVTNTVTYKANGGIGEDQTQTLTYDAVPANLLDGTQFLREGYEIIGWTGVVDGTAKTFDLGEELINGVLSTEDGSEIVLNAVWKQLRTVVKYESNDTEMGSVTVDEESFLETPQGSLAVANDGYHFECWVDADNCWVSENEFFVPQKMDGKYSEVYTAIFAADDEDDVVIIDEDGNGASGDDVIKGVKTGDAVDLGLWLILGVAALVAGGYAMRRKED